jgi:hypothetical protein
MRRDPRVRLALRIRAIAGPGIVAGMAHHAGPHGG